MPPPKFIFYNPNLKVMVLGGGIFGKWPRHKAGILMMDTSAP